MIKKMISISLISSVFLFGNCPSKSGFNYSNAKTFKEIEKNDNFSQAIKTIIPVPYPIDNIIGTISSNKDIDYYLIYLTRPTDVRVTYSGYSGFAPGIILYNQYKQYIEMKTYASSIKGQFNSNVIDFRILKPGFYFLKIANLVNTSSKYTYKIKFIPLDLSLYPTLKKCNKKIINNLNQDKLHDLFYKEIIKKFKNMQKYKSFR